jgi:hypothetical protein
MILRRVIAHFCLLNVIAASLVLQLVEAAGATQGAHQEPTFTPTSPELEVRDQPVTEEDLQILVRADEILIDDTVWSREDDRICEDDELAGRRSLFCALQKACIEVLGAYDHRRVALQEVRFAILDATDGRDFAHRLRDYNNLPETQFDDIKRILVVAREKVGIRLADGQN